MPLTLTEAQRRALSTRIMLQMPREVGRDDAKFIARLVEKTLNGIPGDVLFTLDAIRLLADQGNVVAQELFEMEIERLGFTTKSFR